MDAAARGLASWRLAETVIAARLLYAAVMSKSAVAPTLSWTARSHSIMPALRCATNRKSSIYR